jgi:hypothetical protein
MPPRVVKLKKQPLQDLLRRVGADGTASQLPAVSAEGLAATEQPSVPAPIPSVDEQWSAALACKTDQVVMAIIAQVIQVEEPDWKGLSDDQLERLYTQATAMLAELQPTTATESLLAAQMIGAQRLAMKFMARAVLPGQPFEGVDANVLRATRLMRLSSSRSSR